MQLSRLLLVSFLATASLHSQAQSVPVDGPSTEDSEPTRDNRLDINAYLVIGLDDYGAFHDKEGTESNTHFILRKAKLGFDYEFNNAWRAELGLDYSIERDNQSLDVGDANIDYRGFDFGNIQIGRMLEPFGFERLDGFSSLMTNERSLATSVFAPGRSSYGLRLNNKKKSYTWAIGIFQEASDPASPRSITGRVTAAPVREPQGALHLGLAASYRDFQDQEFQIKDEAEVFSADNVIRSARFDAKDVQLIGAELAGVYHSLTFSSEAMTQQITQTNDRRWHYSGFYTQLAYFLTGEQREYSKGEFKRVKPLRDIGAVELVSRFSAVDLQDNGIGAKAQILMLGVNYYWKKRFLIRLNYLIPDLSGNALHDDPKGEAITLRAQYRF